MHLGLISCGKNKQTSDCMAQDMYLGDLFKKQRAYVERYCDTWAILSAKHYLLNPCDVIAPYDLSLNNMSAKYRLLWAKIVIRQICSQYPTCNHITLLAGNKYTENLSVFIKNAQIKTTQPLAGLGIGQQLAKLKELTQ